MVRYDEESKFFFIFNLEINVNKNLKVMLTSKNSGLNLVQLPSGRSIETDFGKLHS